MSIKIGLVWVRVQALSKVLSGVATRASPPAPARSDASITARLIAALSGFTVSRILDAGLPKLFAWDIVLHAKSVGIKYNIS